MPTSLVVGCLDVLLPVIIAVPGEWKEALVNPLLKKAGLDSVFNNLTTCEYNSYQN